MTAVHESLIPPGALSHIARIVPATPRNMQEPGPAQNACVAIKPLVGQAFETAARCGMAFAINAFTGQHGRGAEYPRVTRIEEEHYAK